MMERPQKRQKLSTEVEDAADDYDGEPTEFKLAILSSLHPDRSEDVLLDYLLAYDGSVSAVTSALSAPHKDDSSGKRRAINGYQSSLSSFAKSNEADDNSATVKQLTKKGRTLHLYVCIPIKHRLPTHPNSNRRQRTSRSIRHALSSTTFSLQNKPKLWCLSSWRR